MSKIPMTLEGFEKLKLKLKKLKNKRPKVILAVASARAHGDLKENAEYHAAREYQSFYEGKIKDIEITLNNAQVIDIKNIPFNEKVIFGSTIRILNMSNNKVSVFQIVGEDESDFKKKKISVNSPLAKALIGLKISDITSVNTPLGYVDYKILNIKYI